MRIGLIVYGSLDILTGGNLYDRTVVDGLARLGHEVEVIELPSVAYHRRLWHNFQSGLCRRLLAKNLDILIEDELCHPSLILINRRLRRQAHRPLLITLVHHTMSDEPRNRWQNMLLAVIERSFLSSVDGFILNSATTREKVAALAPHNLPQVIAYPAGDRLGPAPANHDIQRRAQRAGPLQLLFLGNVIPRKGLRPLLQALAGLDRDLWQLFVVGELDFAPAYSRQIHELVEKLDLSPSVRFLGLLQDDALRDVFASSHIFCMPYAYEGFGIALLEAMAFGLPAIGCRSGAAGETIDHGINGYLLAADDILGLAPLLSRLHGDRQLLFHLALAAKNTYQNHPAWQDSIMAIDAFLQQIHKGR